MTKKLIPIFALLVGCQSNPLHIDLDSEVRISSAFSVDHQQAIIDGVDAWNEATKTRLTTSIVDEDPTASPMSDAEAAARKAFGTTHPDTTIELKQLTNLTLFQTVAMHEIGHALALDHAHAGLMSSPRSRLTGSSMSGRTLHLPTDAVTVGVMLLSGSGLAPSVTDDLDMMYRIWKLCY